MWKDFRASNVINRLLKLAVQNRSEKMTEYALFLGASFQDIDLENILVEAFNNTSSHNIFSMDEEFAFAEEQAEQEKEEDAKDLLHFLIENSERVSKTELLCFFSFALSYGLIEDARSLLKNGLDPHLPDLKGRTPLYQVISLACSNPSKKERLTHDQVEELVENLLAIGTQKSLLENSGLYLKKVAGRGLFHLTEMFLKYGADPNATILLSKRKRSQTPLHYALDRLSLDYAGNRGVHSSLRCIQALIEAGADPEIKADSFVTKEGQIVEGSFERLSARERLDQQNEWLIENIVRRTIKGQGETNIDLQRLKHQAQSLIDRLEVLFDEARSQRRYQVVVGKYIP